MEFYIINNIAHWIGHDHFSIAISVFPGTIVVDIKPTSLISKRPIITVIIRKYGIIK